ncbi:hypothetical protein [Halobellus captivus]|uniref:hypothetical protein n=1 Tax=Halobellus captivus TaxID=2592614 RepID=UPI001EF0A0C6|nr:hypothetical protein [Halobellus captivus]
MTSNEAREPEASGESRKRGSRDGRPLVGGSLRGNRDDAGAAGPDRDELATLRRENARLRRRYDSLRGEQYRKTAIALLAIGVLSLISAVLFPPVRDVLVVLGAIGVFAAAITRYLSPEQFIPVEIGTTVFRAHAKNHAAIVDELGLQDTAVYVPDADRETTRLFVPEHRAYALPSAEELRRTFVVTDDEQRRGVAFEPSGSGLFDEFERSRTGPLGDDPETLARQAADGLVELFELVGSATAEVDTADGRVTVRIGQCRFGGPTAFDTPVASFVSVTIAQGLDTPVVTEVAAETDADFVVTCRWEPSERNG